MKRVRLSGFAMCIAAFFLLTNQVNSQSRGFMIQEGDLLLQDSDCGDFCRAIKKVTQGVFGIGFSHVGVAMKNSQDEWVVVEAISEGVVETPLSHFLSKHTDEEGLAKVAVGRLKEEYQSLIPMAIKSVGKYVGKQYDHAFDIENDSYYCSELIYFIFKEANGGDDIFSLEPMTFIDPESGKTFDIWEEYYRELGMEIPEQKPGLNPGSISRSPKLTILFPYSSFQLKPPAKKSGISEPYTGNNEIIGN